MICPNCNRRIKVSDNNGVVRIGSHITSFCVHCERWILLEMKPDSFYTFVFGEKDISLLKEVNV